MRRSFAVHAKPAISLTFRSTRFRQPRFLSQLRINIRQVFPEPLVALTSQQGVLAVVLPASFHVAFLLSSESLFHRRFLAFFKRSNSAKTFPVTEQTTDIPILYDSDKRRRRGIQIFPGHSENLDPSLCSG
jgi:hypothetical protein